MFKQRLISSIFVFLLTVTFIVLGGQALFIGLLLISLVGLMELYRVIKLNKSVIGFRLYSMYRLLFILVF